MGSGIDPNLLVGGVTFIIWLGVFLYLLRIDGKIKDLRR